MSRRDLIGLIRSAFSRMAIDQDHFDSLLASNRILPALHRIHDLETSSKGFHRITVSHPHWLWQPTEREYLHLWCFGHAVFIFYFTAIGLVLVAFDFSAFTFSLSLIFFLFSFVNLFCYPLLGTNRFDYQEIEHLDECIVY